MLGKDVHEPRQAIAAGVAVSLWDKPCEGADGGDDLIGPLVGHSDTTSAILWARLPKPGRYWLTVRAADGKDAAQRVELHARDGSDPLGKEAQVVADGFRRASFEVE